MKDRKATVSRRWDLPERLPVPFLHLSVAAGYLLLVLFALGLQSLVIQFRLYQETSSLAERTDAQLRRLEALYRIDSNDLSQVEREAGERAVLGAQTLLGTGLKWTVGLLGLGLLGIPLTLYLGLCIRRPMLRMRRAVEGLAEGRLDLEIPHLDFPNEIGNMARSIRVLQTGAFQLEQQRWIKSSLAELTSDIQHSPDFPELARALLNRVSPLLKAGHGAFYLLEEERLNLIATYGLRERKALGASFAVGESLVGQCARERNPITLMNLPPDYVTISSSLGEAPPRCIALLPILSRERLWGVLEFASFHPFGPGETALLDALTPVLAMTMEVLEGDLESRQLLVATQEQARRMEIQAGELAEQKAALDARTLELSQTQAWFHSIIESAPDGLVVLNESGTILLANERAESLFLYDRGEFVGLPFSTLIEGELREQDDVRLRGRRKDGSWVTVEVSFGKMPSTSHGGEGYIACVHGIDARDAAPPDPPASRPMAEAGSVTLHHLATIEGLDVRLGMRRVMGKESLYLKMLARFVEGQAETATSLRQALDEGNLAGAERIAHTARSVCGNIGASGLEELAGQLERDIREQGRSANPSVFIDELTRLLKSLRRLFPAKEKGE